MAGDVDVLVSCVLRACVQDAAISREAELSSERSQSAALVAGLKTDLESARELHSQALLDV